MMQTLPPFVQAIADNWPDDWSISPGISPTCPDCQADYCETPRAFFALYEKGEISDEGSFSWSPCHSCGSALGGMRYAAHALNMGNKDGPEIVHISICADCLFFHANGDIPEGW